ncbi:MAG: hypothetical protein ABW076_17170 [Candidatus Thiodiazotropha sp.]
MSDVRPWIKSLCLLPGLLVSLSVCAACRLDEVDWQANTALSQLLDSCERAPDAQEGWLYTWGHEEKFALLTHDGYGVFRVFNDAQQFTYAGIQARRFLFEYKDYPRFTRYTELLLKSLGTNTVGALYAYSRNQEMLERLQRLWSRQITQDGKIPAPPDDGTRSAARAGLTALAFNQVNPGFLEDLPHSVESLIDATQEALKNLELDQHRRLYLQGRLLGLKRARQAGEGGLPSNISYGPAVYFSNAPHTAIHHYFNGEHTGIACRLTEADRVTDLTDPQDRQAMLAHDVLLHDTQGGAVKYPGGYNELLNPVAYRAETQGRLIRNGKVYADSGLIHYDLPGVCRPIRLDDFRECDALVKLLEVGYFNGGREPGALYRMLTIDEPEQQLQRFLGAMHGCSVKSSDVHARQTHNLPAISNSCDAFNNASFKNGNFYRSNKIFLEQLQKDRCQG